MRYLLGLILVLALAVGAVFLYAGRMPGPTIQITKPVKYVGQSATVEVAITAPGAKLSDFSIAFEQNGKQTPLVSLAQPANAEIKAAGDTVHIARTFTRADIPDLKTGPARIVVTATRPVLRELRKTTASAAHDV